MALRTTFSMALRSRPGSPLTSTHGVVGIVEVTSVAAASKRASSSTSSIKSFSERLSNFGLYCPLSRRATVRIRSSMESSWMVSCSMRSSISSRSARSGPRASASARRMRAMGERNSCETPLSRLRSLCDLVAQFSRHRVEVAHQVGNLVAAIADGGAYANIEIAARQLVGRVTQPLDGLAEIVGDDQAHQRGDNGAEFQHPDHVAGNALRERRRNELADQ